MAKGFYLHKANRILGLNNPFSKSEKSLFKMVLKYTFQTILWQGKFYKTLCKTFFCKQACREIFKKIIEGLKLVF
jgi:hypothetical protein